MPRASRGWLGSVEDGLDGVQLDQVRKEGLNQRRSTEQVRGGIARTWRLVRKRGSGGKGLGMMARILTWCDWVL